jgi:hypothetical protein
MTPRWKASVRVLAARPEEGREFSYALFEAKNKWRAARQVAEWVAIYLYQERGQAGFVAMVDRDKFRAAIGIRPPHDVTRLVGTTIIITLTPEEG